MNKLEEMKDAIFEKYEVEFVNSDVFTNRVFCTLTEEQLYNILEEYGRLQYTRGKNHGVCTDCKLANKVFLKGDKTADEIYGKLEQCQKCSKIKYIREVK